MSFSTSFLEVPNFFKNSSVNIRASRRLFELDVIEYTYETNKYMTSLCLLFQYHKIANHEDIL